VTSWPRPPLVSKRLVGIRYGYEFGDFFSFKKYRIAERKHVS
jgi:hypothetical protein